MSLSPDEVEFIQSLANTLRSNNLNFLRDNPEAARNAADSLESILVRFSAIDELPLDCLIEEIRSRTQAGFMSLKLNGEGADALIWVHGDYHTVLGMHSLFTRESVDSCFTEEDSWEDTEEDD